MHFFICFRPYHQHIQVRKKVVYFYCDVNYVSRRIYKNYSLHETFCLDGDDDVGKRN